MVIIRANNPGDEFQTDQEDAAKLVQGQMLLLLNDPNADASHLEKLLQQDQGLASQVMRIANSPAYLPRVPIESLHQAIAWVGLNLLASTVLSVSTKSGLDQCMNCLIF